MEEKLITQRVAAIEVYKRTRQIKQLQIISVFTVVIAVIVGMIGGMVASGAIIVVSAIYAWQLYHTSNEMKRLEEKYNIDPKIK